MYGIFRHLHVLVVFNGKTNMATHVGKLNIPYIQEEHLGMRIGKLEWNWNWTWNCMELYCDG